MSSWASYPPAEHSGHSPWGPGEQKWLMITNSETIMGQTLWYCKNFPSKYTVSHHSLNWCWCLIPPVVWGMVSKPVVRAEALCCSISKFVVCVTAGKCQGTSWWFRSDQIWNVSGCCMCTDVRGAWSELKKAEWSWWLFRKAVFLIKKDSTHQCS